MRKRSGPSISRLINPIIARGRLYEDMRRTWDAESAYRHALRIADTSVTRSRLLATTAYDNMAWLRQRQKAYQSADSLLMRSLKLRINLFGSESDQVADGLRHLGKFYLDIKDYAGAGIHLERAGSIGARHLRERQMLPILSDQADLFAARHNYDSAEHMYRVVIDGYERHYGASSTILTDPLDDCAEMYRAQGKYPPADSLYRRSIAINRDKPGREIWRAHAEYSLAQLLQEEEKPRDADELFRMAIQHYSDGFGPTDSRLLPMLDTYAKFLRATGRRAAADSVSAGADALRPR